MTRTPRVRVRRFGERACLPACLAVVLLALASSASAAPPGQPAAPEQQQRLSLEARADQLFHAGEKKFDSGDHAGACADFSESLKLGPKLGTLLNLALCHETVGKPVLAWSEFTHAAVWASQNNQRDRYDFAMTHIRALEPKLPRVVLQLPADRAIAGLDLDGEPVPEQRWYLPLYLDPGEHRLAITAPGKKRTTLSFRVTTSPTDQLVYIPSLADDTEKPPAGASTPADPTRRILGFIGLGTGLVGVAVGSTFGVLAMTADERDPVVQDHATVATIAFVAGAAFAAAGGWLLWSSARAPGAKTTSAMVLPHRDGAAFGLTTSF